MKLRNTTSTTPDQGAARETATLEGLDLVNSLANRLLRRVPPSVTFDDLASAGTIGLIQAVDRFDNARGLKFKTYAQHRIRGAMLDFLRGEDPLSRTERRRVRESGATLSASGYGDGPTTVSLDQIPAAALRRLCAGAQHTLAAVTMPSELRQARRCLSVRENRVIALLYDFGWRSHEIAAALHISESRVSQIKQRALSKLRVTLTSATTRAA